MNRIIQSLLFILMIAVFSSSALADGMIVPIRRDLPVRGTWAVKHHHVDITVADQVASVAIDQEFVNTSAGMLEVEYLFPVPPDAAIDSMTLVVNGREFSAKLYKAEDARRIYEDIVRTKKDPALLEYAGFGMYRTKAFPLEPGKPAKVVVNYKSVCKKNNGVVEVWYPLNTEKFSAKPIEDVAVRVDIKSRADITSIYSPSHDLSIDRRDARHVIATYHASKTTPSTDFQVFYKAADEAVGATLLTHQPSTGKDGYFLLLVSPNPRNSRDNVVAKDVVVALDRSGSMSGEKIQQAKEALRFVLKNLNSEDRFNVLIYSDDVATFFDKLMPATRNNIEKAQDMVDRIEAMGGTNIYDAVSRAMNMFEDGKRPGYLIFLTDGQPTVGRTQEKDILSAAKTTNKTNVRLFCFGVGYDVNIRLLDKLCDDNHGRSDYVKPNEPIEGKISSLYGKIRNPVMTELAMKINGVQLKDMYPRQLDDLFEGDQIIVAGRYDATDVSARDSEGNIRATLVITGKYQGTDKTFEYPVSINPPGQDMRFAFVEKVWAMRRVGFLLDQIQLNGESKEVVDELIRLSRDYGIMTPYTSFLADERTPLVASAPMLREHAKESLRTLSDVNGDVGQRNAMNRQALNQAGGGFGGGGFGGGYAMATTQPGAAQIVGWSDKSSYEAKSAQTVANVRNVGNQALYRRGRTWVAPNAAQIELPRDEAKVKTIQRFSPEYFALVKANTAAENQILSSQRADEELLVEFRGQVYNIR